ncbi:STM4504/CBY_0614 family protein [Paenibacillus polymyxa]|uniref:STM4504/CBY_0614 family protein n=1 Tax=Paenibacillus polymyxa TaxID=1406 RepID=UPI002ED671CA|nr:hypothetical protein [Paenibacillus polymyxa]
MAIFELFSKREKNKLQKTADPYQYDELPIPLRVQIVHILRDAAGEGDYLQKYSISFWDNVHSTMTRELGIFNLTDNFENNYRKCTNFLLSANTENALDIIEYAFFLIDKVVRKAEYYVRDANNMTMPPDAAIHELNYRFREHRVGYQFEGSQLIRIDSQLTHEEVVKPTLSLLYDLKFQGAEEEYLKAHKHYREGRYKEAIAEALKSFESTMKTICVRMDWGFKPSDTSNKLIDLLVKKELIPLYMQQHFNSLRSTLESGVPVLRNKTSGHGQGEETVEIPEHYASYALHLSASNILFLAKCYLDKKK